MDAALGVEQRVEPVVDEGVGVRAGDDEHRAAKATVTAARTAAGDEFFAAERQTSGAAVACFYVDIDFVYKHRVIA